MNIMTMKILNLLKRTACLFALIYMTGAAGILAQAEDAPEVIENADIAEEEGSPSPIDTLPEDVKTSCEQAASEFGIDQNILKALVYTESRGDVQARNGSHIGLTQLNPRYFKDTMELLGITDPYEPIQNLRICAYTLSSWMAKYDNTYIVIDCWHKGEGRAVAANDTDGTGYSREILSNANAAA